MWTIAAVNKKFDGPLGSYNSLTDVHLAHYFSRPSRQSHLKAAKLVTDDGFIVPEKNVKVELHYDEKKKKMYDFLARSILQNAVLKEGSWNKKLSNYLEDVSKMAAVDIARKTIRKKSSKVASEVFCEHPLSALEKSMARSSSKLLKNKILKPPNSAPVTCFCFTNDREYKTANLKRSLSAKLYSPYGIPLVLSGAYREHSQPFFDYQKTLKNKKRKRKKFNNSIGNSKIPEKKNIIENRNTNVCIPQQSLKFSQCKVTMFYHGHVLLTNFQKTLTQNILIKQQHCGGIPVVIYKGKISPNELLSFFSLDHEGFFFSIIVFLNGIRELKLSSCCVFRYLPGRRLGGPNGTFSVKSIEGGKPCLKCQYQEYENNGFKVVSETSDFIEENSAVKENSVVALNDSDDEITKNISASSNREEIHDTATDVPSIHDDESFKVISEVNNAEEYVDEILDELPNQEIGEELSNGLNEENSSSYEEEIKEQESNHSVSSANESDISEKVVEIPMKCEISIGTSSSEDEEEKQHVITVSVHESPENSL